MLKGALLSRHNIILHFLGLRGQAETRMARSQNEPICLMSTIPLLRALEVVTNPFAPLNQICQGYY